MTIKTQEVEGQTRIITKLVEGQRRVSCSCCAEPECCMYPADQFGITYIADDLPDEIEFAAVGSEGNFQTAARDGTNFIIEDGFAPGEDLVVGLYNGSWQLWVEAGSGPDFIAGDYSNNCLINWPFADSDRIPAVADTFADTYTVTTAQSSGTVTRQSLCLWTGVDGNGCPLTLLYEDQLNVWELYWFVFIQGLGCESGEGGPKEDPQNSPVGTYNDVGAGSSATVS